MATAGHPIEGVLHVGVRDGEDLPDYRGCGASPCIYVEPIRAVFDRLNAQFEGDDWHIVLLATCSDREGNRGYIDAGQKAAENASLSLPAVTTYTVDVLAESYSPRRPPNLLVIDARGAELLVLRGSSLTLPSVDGVFVAVSETRSHPMACTLNEVQTLLQRFDLRPRWIELDGHGCGHAFFTRPRKKPEDLPTYGGNLALGKAAGQSSLCIWSRPEMHEEARGAINGQITGEFGFHTELEDHPWWLVDLGRPHSIQEVRVYNRLGVLRSRARTLRVLTSEDGSEWWEVHDQAGYTFGGADGRPLRVLLEPCRARYVALRLAERTWLHLDEVEIY